MELTQRQKEFDEAISRITPEWRLNWCENRVCACMGGVNCSGGLRGKFTREDWLDWKRRHKPKRQPPYFYVGGTAETYDKDSFVAALMGVKGPLPKDMDQKTLRKYIIDNREKDDDDDLYPEEQEWVMNTTNLLNVPLETPFIATFHPLSQFGLPEMPVDVCEIEILTHSATKKAIYADIKHSGKRTKISKWILETEFVNYTFIDYVHPIEQE